MHKLVQLLPSPIEPLCGRNACSDGEVCFTVVTKGDLPFCTAGLPSQIMSSGGQVTGDGKAVGGGHGGGKGESRRTRGFSGWRGGGMEAGMRQEGVDLVAMMHTGSFHLILNLSPPFLSLDIHY